jgi:fatty-acyl-CoA synthase
MSDPVVSTMQDAQLTITSLLRHGRTVYADSVGADLRRRQRARGDVRRGRRARRRLAGALAGLGVQQGDRVGHVPVEHPGAPRGLLRRAVDGRGAAHAQPAAVPRAAGLRHRPRAGQVVIVDATVLPLLAKVADQIPTVGALRLVGDGDTERLGDVPGLRYEDLLAAAPATYDWPELDERSPMAMCYTSGTTGNPKGVVYSHRSTYLHSMASVSGNGFGISERDTVLPVVPMFHAAAWGLAYSGWLAGADFVLPGRFLQAEPLARMISELRPTVAGAVPTIWNDLLSWVDEHPTDLTSLRLVACGGSAVPLSLMQRFEQDHGMHIVQAWGMTETSPLAAIAHVPAGTPDEEEWTWRGKTGRVMAGVEMRLVDDRAPSCRGTARPSGRCRCAGPWITGAYHRDPDPEKFMDGWLRTGDVATVPAQRLHPDHRPEQGRHQVRR